MFEFLGLVVGALLLWWMFSGDGGGDDDSHWHDGAGTQDTW